MARAAQPLPASADVVVIGGGVMGASAAFHLAEAGADVLLLERGELAGGSTGRAAGGVRAQFSDALNIALGHRSLAAFADFGRRPGWEIDLRRVGYLFLLDREDDAEAFARSVALQQSLGVPSRILEPAEARELCPLLDVGDVVAAAYSPDDGHATPDAVVQGYAAGARRHGARVVTGCEVVGLDAGAVRTTRGDVVTDTVICTAGPWSREVGELAGVALPVEAVRRRVLFTEPMAGLPERLPMTIDFTTGFYFHREGPGLLLGMADEGEGSAALLEVAERRAPRIAEAGIRGGWTGFYEVTPDHNALIGEAQPRDAAPRRFLYATGFSGHGFLQGPAVGEILRDLVLGHAPFADVAPLAVDRFDHALLRPEHHVV